MTSRDGARIGYLRAVIVVRRDGKTLASHADRIHRNETKANWTRVRVAGISKALRMDLDEVLVRAEDVYHRRQRICQTESACSRREVQVEHTTSLGDTGARRASA